MPKNWQHFPETSWSTARLYLLWCYAPKQRLVLKNSTTILLTECSFNCWIQILLVVWLTWISFSLESFYCSVHHMTASSYCVWCDTACAGAQKP